MASMTSLKTTPDITTKHTMPFDEIYAVYYQGLVRQAQKLLPTTDSHEAIQLVSDVFVEVDVDLKRGKVINKPAGYIYTKLNRKILDWLRRKYSPRQLVLENTDPEFLTGSEMPPDKKHALREQLDNALSHLKPIERQAIKLCYVDGHTHREAAAVQKVPVSTFEKRLLSATSKARQYLQRGDASCCEPSQCMT